MTTFKTAHAATAAVLAVFQQAVIDGQHVFIKLMLELRVCSLSRIIDTLFVVDEQDHFNL